MTSAFKMKVKVIEFVPTVLTISSLDIDFDLLGICRIKFRIDFCGLLGCHGFLVKVCNARANIFFSTPPRSADVRLDGTSDLLNAGCISVLELADS